MSEAPERIWAARDEKGRTWWQTVMPHESMTPYTREDLHTAEIARLQERVKALEGALGCWLHSYAPEFCDEATVAASAKMVHDAGGTLAFIADLTRAALEQEGGE